jgi:hypothetical protein
MTALLKGPFDRLTHGLRNAQDRLKILMYSLQRWIGARARSILDGQCPVLDR